MPEPQSASAALTSLLRLALLELFPGTITAVVTGASGVFLSAFTTVALTAASFTGVKH
jgi:hypothetical protein